MQTFNKFSESLATGRYGPEAPEGFHVTLDGKRVTLIVLAYGDNNRLVVWFEGGGEGTLVPINKSRAWKLVKNEESVNANT